MFDKFKQVSQMTKLSRQAKQLQKELELIKEKQEKGDFVVAVTGDQKVAYIKQNGEDMKELTDLINKAMKEVQKKAAKKMMEMGGGLSGLFGN